MTDTRMTARAKGELPASVPARFGRILSCNPIAGRMPVLHYILVTSYQTEHARSLCTLVGNGVD